MKKQLIAAAAACVMSAPVMAQGHNYIDGFIALSEAEVGNNDDDGVGFGLKGDFQIADKIFLGGLYENIDYDDSDEIEQIRFGAVFGPGAGSRNAGIYGRAEYVNFDNDGPGDQDGFGGTIGYAHPISPEFRVYGEAGYLVLDDLDGPELRVGGTFQVAPNVAIFSDFGGAFLEVDNSNADIDIVTFRAGARFLF